VTGPKLWLSLLLAVVIFATLTVLFDRPDDTGDWVGYAIGVTIFALIYVPAMWLINRARLRKAQRP
jgi:hypothetical protein